jgi:hypothetical protein
MKNLKKLTVALMVLFSVSLFAQRSTFYDGTYSMEYGNQTMKIIHEGGSSYKAVFSGDCNAQTLKGNAEYGDLEIPLAGGGNRDMIIIRHQGNKLDVTVTNNRIMRDACNGSSIEGLYKKKDSYSNNSYSNYNENYNHKRYNSDNFNNSYNSRDSRKYGSHANVHDLMNIPALEAYDKLQDRGFSEVKNFHSKDGKTYRVWYNNETNQCIKTISIKKRIHDVLKSTHCH